MIQKLTPEEVVKVLKGAPEQGIFDWKRDMSWEGDDKKSEVVKDIVAVANGTTASPGFVFYGVDARLPNPILGMSKSYDDASFQQLLLNKVDPPVEFLYYEVSHGPKVVGVVHIPPSRRRPHIIARDFGKVREGQLLIRRGSSTGAMTQSELLEIFYGASSPYLAAVLRHYGIEPLQTLAEVARMRELREQMEQIKRDMHEVVGF